MGNSLQDQLLKAGLASKKQVQKNATDKKKRRKQGKQADHDEISLAKAYAVKAKQEKQAHDKALNEKLELERKRREANKTVQDLVKKHALNAENADIARFFQFGNKIRKLYLTKAQQKDLNANQSGIVHFKGRFYLLALEHFLKAQTVKPESVAFFYDPNEAQAHSDGGDYPEVPDDLMW